MSEIILQQTRVEQGRGYYEKFISHYPDVSSLANADEETVFKLWEGLGYYSRCRNMISAAKTIHNEHAGKFPEEISRIRALPGVGNYTAAAIASFAFDQPFGVLDGNVYRILSRFFGIYDPIDTSAGRKLFENLSDSLLDREKPAAFNQAIMDFGAIVCKPRQPLCNTCVLAKKCIAYSRDHINDLPVKSKKLVRKTRWFNFLIILNGEKVVIEKRELKDIWKDLYQFPMVESEEIPPVQNWILGAKTLAGGQLRMIFQQTQQLTHQTIHGRFFVLKITDTHCAESGTWVKIEDLKKFPFPRMIARILPDLRHSIS